MAFIIDTAIPALKEIVRRCRNKRALNKVVATSGTQVVRDHFAENASRERNKFGKPAMFWKRMSRATRAEADESTAAIVMPREVAQRYFGGTIRPTGGRKLLTIPARAESYRRSARSFPDLVLVIFKKRSGSSPVGALIRQGAKQTSVMYWLVAQVTQKGDSRVMPTAEKIANSVKRDVREYLIPPPNSQPAEPTEPA